ncbi:right-handed parallel beta-helix repeat-containing protein [bacterium]|nr:right-handed parallel beta-helix repeat-containing protein [bacterium]
MRSQCVFTRKRPFRAVLVSLAVLPLLAQAAPSGGPYGPVRKFYQVPKNAVHVYYVAPDGKAEDPGLTPDKPTTLHAAFEKVVTGDAVILRGGTYRAGGLRLNQGITMQPYRDEVPVIKGTAVAEQWQAQRDKTWRTSWSTLFPAKPDDWWRRHREGMRTPLYRFNNDMVFVDGVMLHQKGWEGELDEHSFSIDYEKGNVYIGVDPAGKTVEITAFDDALIRVPGECHGKKSDGKGPVIRGITFTQYAYRAIEVQGKEAVGPADPSTFGKDVIGTTLEDVTITHCSRVAGYFHGDRTTFRNCRISDTSTEGLYLIGSADCLLERNIFMRNNVERITGYYPAAVKIFNQCYRTVCRDNLVLEQPYSEGIWYDVGNVDGVFVNNWVQGAVNGFFFEISKGAVCAGNVFVDCANGSFVLNSSNVRIANNTYINAPAKFQRTERSAVGDHFGWHPATGPGVDKRDGHIFENNVCAAGPGYRDALLRFEQAAVLCGKLDKPQASSVDGNVYVRTPGAESDTLIHWAPASEPDCGTGFVTPDEAARAIPGIEPHGRLVVSDLGSVFMSPELGNYRPVPKALSPTGVRIPESVLKLIGVKSGKAVLPGAYQPGK